MINITFHSQERQLELLITWMLILLTWKSILQVILHLDVVIFMQSFQAEDTDVR